MDLGYFWWIFHRLIRKNPATLMTVSVIARATASFFVVSTIFRKRRSISLLILCEPCGEGFKWSVLRFYFWRIVDSGPTYRGSRKGWVMSQIETDFLRENTCTLAHCQPGSAQWCSIKCLDANSWRHGVSQTSFSKSLKHNPRDPLLQQIHKTWSQHQAAVYDLWLYLTQWKNQHSYQIFHSLFTWL